jgi:hypothetical protein
MEPASPRAALGAVPLCFDAAKAPRLQQPARQI